MQVFSIEELIGEISFIGTIFSQNFFGEVDFLGTLSTDLIYGEVSFNQETVNQFPYITGEVNFVDPDYFPGIANDTEDDPLPDELCASFGSNVYAVCPDIQEAYPIPLSELLECNLKWYGNTPITGNIKLKNSDRKYTNPNDASFGGIFTEEEIYSNTKNSRKYLYIEQMSLCGTKTNYILFPRMVITSVTGTHTLNINFVDEISYYLFYRRVTLPTYCFDEALTRIDSTHYASYTLTEFYYERNGSTRQSEFYINSEQKVPFGLDYVECTLQVSPAIENINIPVVLRNPKLSKEIIKNLVDQVIDSQTGLITKEYLQVEMNYSDFFIYNTIEIQKTDIISILKRNIFDAIPADFWIKPIMNYSPFGTGSDLSVEAESLAHSSYKPTLVIQDVLLEDEFYTPNYKIPELIVRGETEPQLTGLQKFNSQKVMKPGIIGKTYVLEINDAKTATSDVPSTPSEIPIPTQELSVMYSYRWHPIIPLIWIEQIAGINMVKQGTVNDVTYFQDSNYNLTITETQTFEWQPGQNIRPLTEIFDSISYPNGFTGVRSGTLQFTSGAVINIILWDEPYFEQPNQYQQVI